MQSRFSLLCALTLVAGCNCCPKGKPMPESSTPPATASAPQSAPAPATAPVVQAEPAWRELFDGKTLDGWRDSGFGGSAEASVEDGAIRIPMGDRLSGITSTRTDLPKTNYEIALDARRVD